MTPSAPTLDATDAALYWTLAVLASAAAVVLVWSCVEARRRRTALPLLALLGGVIALPIEPYQDVNVLFTFATNSEPIAFTAFDRPIPLYLACVYPAFIGFGSYMAYRLMRNGASTRMLLSLAVAAFVADAAIEITGRAIDVWAYYGPQAWNPFEWPIYFGVLNATIPLLGGTIMVFLDRRLAGPWRALIALSVPTAYAGIYAIAGWPTWVALNADVPSVVVWVAGASTMALAAGVCWLCATHSPSHPPEQAREDALSRSAVIWPEPSVSPPEDLHVVTR